jgi:hypothetical protein
MFDDLTWGAILEQWPWFGGAAVVLIIAVGMLIAVKPKSNAPKTTYAVADGKDWRLTGWIDFADSQPAGGLVLEVEETQTSISLSGAEHHEIRWRRGTLSDAKMILKSYRAQRNLAMLPTFTVSTPAGIQWKGNGQGERIDAEIGDVAIRQDMVEATLVPQDVTR